jgi:hypothetical protein
MSRYLGIDLPDAGHQKPVAAHQKEKVRSNLFLLTSKSLKINPFKSNPYLSQSNHLKPITLSPWVIITFLKSDISVLMPYNTAFYLHYCTNINIFVL